MSLLAVFMASAMSSVATTTRNVIRWDDRATSGMSCLYEIIRFVMCVQVIHITH